MLEKAVPVPANGVWQAVPLVALSSRTPLARMFEDEALRRDGVGI